MNWIQIDKMLIGIIERNDTTEEIYQEAEKQFKWTRGQSKSAIDPLLKRHSFNKIVNDEPEKRSVKLTKTKKKL